MICSVPRLQAPINLKKRVQTADEGSGWQGEDGVEREKGKKKKENVEAVPDVVVSDGGGGGLGWGRKKKKKGKGIFFFFFCCLGCVGKKLGEVFWVLESQDCKKQEGKKIAQKPELTTDPLLLTAPEEHN